jgi:tryptophanyl-tRNA synthetase
MAREVARRFNHLYCGISSHASDEESQALGGLFPVIQPVIGRVRRLVGTGAPGPNGNLLKMSKSLNNSILLSDDADTVRSKIMGMYTDPNRLRPTDKGTVENNPLWIFHETFNPDKAWVAEAEDKYRNGQIGDVECKRRLIDVINTLLDPMRERRKQFETQPDYIVQVLKEGTEKANTIAEETLRKAKAAMHQDYFNQDRHIAWK